MVMKVNKDPPQTDQRLKGHRVIKQEKVLNLLSSSESSRKIKIKIKMKRLILTYIRTINKQKKHRIFGAFARYF